MIRGDQERIDGGIRGVFGETPKMRHKKRLKPIRKLQSKREKTKDTSWRAAFRRETDTKTRRRARSGGFLWGATRSVLNGSLFPYVVQQNELKKERERARSVVQIHNVVTEFDEGSGLPPGLIRDQGNLDFYSNDNLIQRKNIRNSEIIKRILSLWWKTCDPLKHGGVLKMNEYLVLNTKIQKAVDPDFEPRHALKMAKQDWKRDAQGKSALTEDMFNASIFEIADMWTDSVDVQDYAQCLTGLLSTISEEISQGQLRFRGTQSIETVDRDEAGKIIWKKKFSWGVNGVGGCNDSRDALMWIGRNEKAIKDGQNGTVSPSWVDRLAKKNEGVTRPLRKPSPPKQLRIFRSAPMKPIGDDPISVPSLSCRPSHPRDAHIERWLREEHKKQQQESSRARFASSGARLNNEIDGVNDNATKDWQPWDLSQVAWGTSKKNEESTVRRPQEVGASDSKPKTSWLMKTRRRNSSGETMDEVSERRSPRRTPQKSPNQSKDNSILPSLKMKLRRLSVEAASRCAQRRRSRTAIPSIETTTATARSEDDDDSLHRRQRAPRRLRRLSIENAARRSGKRRASIENRSRASTLPLHLSELSFGHSAPW